MDTTMGNLQATQQLGLNLDHRIQSNLYQQEFRDQKLFTHRVQNNHFQDLDQQHLHVHFEEGSENIQDEDEDLHYSDWDNKMMQI